MINGSLPDRLEYTILAIVAGSPYGCRQDHWDGWEYEVRRRVPDCTRRELLSAFKRLWNGGNGALDLTNSDDHPHYYSGDQADDKSFFFTGQLNAVLTPTGRSYWGLLRIEKKKAAIGLPQACREGSVQLQGCALLHSLGFARQDKLDGHL